MTPTSQLLAAGLLAVCLLSAPVQAALVAPDAAAGASTSSTDHMAVWLAATANDGSRAFALAAGHQPMTSQLRATAAAVGALTGPSAQTLSLWTFITTMRAQQQGDRFVALETSAALLRLAEGPVAPVPLPGALWLLVMGLLGMAGVRVTGQGQASGSKAGAAGHEPVAMPGLAVARA